MTIKDIKKIKKDIISIKNLTILSNSDAIELILTCCRAQYLVAKYDPMEREACRLRHTHLGPIASYNQTKIALPRDSLS